MKTSYIRTITTAVLAATCGINSTLAGEKYTVKRALDEGKNPLVHAIPAERYQEFLESRVGYMKNTEGTPGGAITLMINEDSDSKTPAKPKYDVWVKDNTIRSIRKRGTKTEDQFTGIVKFDLGDIVAGEDLSKETTDSSALENTYISDLEFPDGKKKGNVLFVEKDDPTTEKIEHEARYVIKTDRLIGLINGLDEINGLVYVSDPKKSTCVIVGWDLITEEEIKAPSPIVVPKTEDVEPIEQDTTSKVR